LISSAESLEKSTTGVASDGFVAVFVQKDVIFADTGFFGVEILI
jgi:hypothetical protein